MAEAAEGPPNWHQPVAKVFKGAGSQTWRLLPTRANGGPAFGLYKLETSGKYEPFGVQTLTFEGADLADITTFILPALFARFVLPGTLPG